MRKMTRPKVMIGILTVVAVLAAILLLSSGESDALVRDRLEQEFEGSYPVSPEPTGELVEIELVAAPTTVELRNGVQTNVWAYAGMWALHCHILEHAAAGMTTMVYVPKRTEK